MKNRFAKFVVTIVCIAMMTTAFTVLASAGGLDDIELVDDIVYNEEHYEIEHTDDPLEDIAIMEKTSLVPFDSWSHKVSDGILRKSVFIDDYRYMQSSKITYDKNYTYKIHVAAFNRYTYFRILWLDAYGNLVARSAAIWAKANDLGAGLTCDDINSLPCNGSKANAACFVIEVYTGAATLAAAEEAYDVIGFNNCITVSTVGVINYDPAIPSYMRSKQADMLCAIVLSYFPSLTYHCNY